QRWGGFTETRHAEQWFAARPALRDQTAEPRVLPPAEVAQARAEERDRARAAGLEQRERAIVAGGDPLDVQRGVATAERATRLLQPALVDVDRDVGGRAGGAPGVEQKPGLRGRARPELDQRAGPDHVPDGGRVSGQQ